MGLREKLIYRATLVNEIIFTGQSHEGFDSDSNKLYIRTSNEQNLLFEMSPKTEADFTTLIVCDYGLCLQCSRVVSWWPFRFFPGNCVIS